MVIHTYFCIKGYDYVERFVRILVLLVINTRCPEKLLKMGNSALLISSSNYAKTPYKCVHRRRFVFCVFFSNFSDAPCMKVGFDVRISPRLMMNEGRFPQVGDSIFFCLPRLYLCLRGNSLLGPVHMIPGQLIALGNSLTPGSTLPGVNGATH